MVFYVESSGDWTHVGPIVEELLRRGTRVSYLSSDPEDPRLSLERKGLSTFFIGQGTIRTLLFVSLEAAVMVLTMPDLETFHIKRSTAHPTHYVYVFHSIVSTHMIYRERAFDHFDTILCVGPHHVAEIREAETLRGTAAKRLVEHGYARLDGILKERETRPPGEEQDSEQDSPTVLVAPTWGPSGILERFGPELVQGLLDEGLRVIVRPHPETRRSTPQVISTLERRFGGDERFSLDQDMNSKDSLYRSAVMISDWSGAALEYAFGLLKPVIFVDTPRKVNNPNYEQLSITPLEVSIREQLGKLIPESELSRICGAAREIGRQRDDFRNRIETTRNEVVFNLGRSSEVAADAIERTLSDTRRA